MIKTELLEFQNETVSQMKVLEEKHDGGMLLNSPGLGKTICCIVNTLKEEIVKRTLIVCPAGLVNNWIEEIQKHTTLPKEKIVKYYGKKRKNLQTEDACFFITSYSIISREYTSVPTNENKHFCKDSLLNEVMFERIILDEGHYIRNQRTSISKAIVYLGDMSLNAKKWVVTATPIFNDFKDVFVYFKFLGIEDGKRGDWTRSINKSINGLKILNTKIETHSIKFIKEDVLKNLTPKSEVITYLKFSKIEREFYDSLCNYSQNRMLSMLKKIKRLGNSDVDIGGSMRKLLHGNVMVYILRLKQACNSPWMILMKMKRLQACKTLEDAVVKLDFYNLSETIKEECPICYDVTADRIANCGHKCCGGCWDKMFNLGVHTCPKCRAFVEETFEIGIKKEEINEQITLRELKISTKINKILDLTKEIISRNEKVVIVSQWVSMLNIVRTVFSSSKSLENMKFISLQGNVPLEQRSKNIKQFQEDSETKICFISLMSSAEGINLTASNNLVLIDNWWNNSKMIQVCDRVHRIGQKKDVNIYKFYIENSVEERIKKRLEQKHKINSLILNKWTITDTDNYDNTWMDEIVTLIEKKEEEEYI